MRHRKMVSFRLPDLTEAAGACVPQPDSWRRPAEVVPEEEWKHFYQVVIDEAVRQWCPGLQACVRAHGGHSKHRLQVCWRLAIRTDAHLTTW